MNFRGSKNNFDALYGTRVDFAETGHKFSLWNVQPEKNGKGYLK